MENIRRKINEQIFQRPFLFKTKQTRSFPKAYLNNNNKKKDNKKTPAPLKM